MKPNERNEAMADTKTFKRTVPVQLSDAELLVVAHQLSAALKRHERVDLRRSRAVKLFKTRLDDLKSNIRSRNDTLATGIEQREVECIEVRDLFAKKIRVVRFDDGSLVEERDLVGDELQLELGVAAAAAGDGAVEGTVLQMPVGGGRAGDRARQETVELTEAQRLALTPEEAEELRQHALAAEQTGEEPQAEQLEGGDDDVAGQAHAEEAGEELLF